LKDPEIYGVVSSKTCGKKIRLVASNSRIARIRRRREGGRGKKRRT
jgi:hypothetical protein